MDAVTRDLELQLQRSPDDLQLRQRLLSHYLRSGYITNKTIAELAALHDPAAIAIRGPASQASLSKRFYLCCGFAALAYVFQQWDRDKYAKYFDNPKEEEWIPYLNPANYAQTYSVLDTGLQLVRTWLETGQKIELPLVVFRQGEVASMEDVAEVMHINSMSRISELMYIRPSYAYVLNSMCQAYTYLISATEKQPKKKVDDVIRLCAALDHIVANNFIDDARGWEFKYWHHRTQILEAFMQKIRPDIIRLLVPGYTP